MEGKLPILFLFIILNNAYSLPSVRPQGTNKLSQNNSNIASLRRHNLSSRNDDEPYNSKENQGTENNGIIGRPLTVGDTFTPSELLPVTQKLIEKIDNPGQGKGIVSAARSPEDLADKLFEAFFFSPKRIVILDEDDITGLDALQALALSGQVTYLRDHVNVPVTEASDQVTMSFRGQTISIDTQPKKSKYQLLAKKDDKKIIKKTAVRRGAIKLAEKLWKNRHIIVNPGRKHNAAYKFSKKAEISRTKETRGGSIKQKSLIPHINSNKTFCHWRYHCTNPTDLDTCLLKTECNKKTPIVEFHGVPHLPDEHSRSMQQFRKMLGITLIDEEVEKILEKRYLKKTPFSGRPGPDTARLESLSEYFNNIIMNDFMKSTKAYPTAIPLSSTGIIDSDGGDNHYEQYQEQMSVAEDQIIHVTPSRPTPEQGSDNIILSKSVSP